MSAFSTDNPRHLRALGALMRGPLTRNMLDEVSGAANSPDMVQELRRRGLAIPCKRVDALDRDGRPCKPGVYHLTVSDRRLITRFVKQRATIPPVTDSYDLTKRHSTLRWHAFLGCLI
jgi:hypothetical protein